VRGRGPLLTAVVALVACGADGTGLTSDERGVAVVVLGVLTHDAAICPVGQPDCSTALLVQGDRGRAVVGDFVIGRGWYDGARLLLADSLDVGESPFGSPDFSSLCPGMRNATGEPDELVGKLNDVLGRGDAGHDALATLWWDDESNVFTLWFARDLARYREPLLAAAGESKVCLADGARFSERELDAAADTVGLLAQSGVFGVQGGYGVDARKNRVVVPIEALDASGRLQLDRLGAVLAVPFVELLDRPLAQLPPRGGPIAGTVDLLTASSRSSGGMAALVRFTLRYDAVDNCLFFDAANRTTIVWPYGYVATEVDGVVTVFDGNGEPVARVGDELELGGGEVPVGSMVQIDGDNLCGATEMWVVAT